MIWTLFLMACGGEPTEPIEPECPACPEASSSGIEDWEMALLQPQLDSIRGGVTPWSDESWGICSGIQKCEEYLGTEVETLPEGDHLLFVELKVPQLGDGWKLQFNWACDTHNIHGRTTSQDHEKEYTVRYSGPNRGFRLLPLWRIKSPHLQGARDCTYEMTSVRPDGTTGETWSGSYSTPAPPAAE